MYLTGLHHIMPLKSEREETRIARRKVSLFWKYVDSHKEIIEKCMNSNTRKKEGMPCDQFGTPLCSYTNQLESVNNKGDLNL